MSKLYPTGFRVKFDEGDEIQVAKERIDEFSEESSAVEQSLKESSTDKFKVKDEKIQRKKKSKKDKTYSDKINALVAKTKKIKKDKKLVHMIKIFATTIGGLAQSNGSKRLSMAFEKVIIDETITVDSILKAQVNFDKLGSKVNLTKELEDFNKNKKEKNR